WDWFADRPAGGAARQPTSGSPGVNAFVETASPEPTPTESLPPDAIECNQPIGWRLALLDLATDRLTKTWIVADPVSAVGPADAALRPLVVPADEVMRLGFCADHQAPDTGAARSAAGWHFGASGSRMP